MDIKEIRDRLIQKKTLYDSAVKLSQQACHEIKEINAQFNEEEIELLAQSGFDIRKLLDVDLERLKSEPKYLEDYQTQLTKIMEEIGAYLEGELNV